MRSVFILFFVMLTLTGCEMVRGMGRDLKNTGNNIGDAFRSEPVDSYSDPVVNNETRYKRTQR